MRQFQFTKGEIQATVKVDGDETVTLAITVSGASNSNNPDIIGDAV